MPIFLLLYISTKTNWWSVRYEQKSLSNIIMVGEYNFFDLYKQNSKKEVRFWNMHMIPKVDFMVMSMAM